MSTKVCQNCGFNAGEKLKKCPQCGANLPVSLNWRVRGWIQLALGIFLVGFMGVITYNLAPSLLQPSAPSSGSSTFTGTQQQALIILGLFGVLIMLGLSSMLSGIYQIVTGRRNKWLFILFIGVTLLLIAFAWLVFMYVGK